MPISHAPAIPVSKRVRIAFAAIVTVAVISAIVATCIPMRSHTRVPSASALYTQTIHADYAKAGLFPQEPSRITSVDPVFAGTRAIARQANIGIRVENLTDAFAQISGTARPALGEFVQSSSYHAQSHTHRAQITLRIAADRLNAALSELRAIGGVTHESSSADDVTDRLVDLDAHIRNEQRVEREMLELLDTRSGDPLKDLLTLRESLASVRLQIERLQAQHNALQRRVTFATVQVLLHTDQPVQESGIFAEAWSAGVGTLTASIAWLLRVAVAGTLAWLILASLALIVWRVHRAHASVITNTSTG